MPGFQRLTGLTLVFKLIMLTSAASPCFMNFYLTYRLCFPDQHISLRLPPAGNPVTGLETTALVLLQCRHP
jgi:hypothetical protein